MFWIAQCAKLWSPYFMRLTLKLMPSTQRTSKSFYCLPCKKHIARLVS